MEFKLGCRAESWGALIKVYCCTVIIPEIYDPALCAFPTL